MSGEVERKHGPGCPCTRCVGFKPGHELTLRHGAYADVALGPRVDELSGELEQLVPAYSPSDAIAVRLLGLALARLERAEAALEAAAPADMARLRTDALGWANSARRLLNDLGMTPTSRARLGLDLSRMAGGGLAQLAADGRALRVARLDDDDGEGGGV